MHDLLIKSVDPSGIRAIRESAGLTPDEAAIVAGLPLDTINAWEDGQCTPEPGFLTWYAIVLDAHPGGWRLTKGQNAN